MWILQCRSSDISCREEINKAKLITLMRSSSLSEVLQAKIYFKNSADPRIGRYRRLRIREIPDTVDC